MIVPDKNFPYIPSSNYTFFYRCDVIIHLFDDAQKVTVEDNVCTCGAQLVNVEYKQVNIINLKFLHVSYISLKKKSKLIRTCFASSYLHPQLFCDCRM